MLGVNCLVLWMPRREFDLSVLTSWFLFSFLSFFFLLSALRLEEETVPGSFSPPSHLSLESSPRGAVPSLTSPTPRPPPQCWWWWCSFPKNKIKALASEAQALVPGPSPIFAGGSQALPVPTPSLGLATTLGCVS